MVCAQSDRGLGASAWLGPVRPHVRCCLTRQATDHESPEPVRRLLPQGFPDAQAPRIVLRGVAPALCVGASGRPGMSRVTLRRGRTGTYGVAYDGHGHRRLHSSPAPGGPAGLPARAGLRRACTSFRACLHILAPPRTRDDVLHTATCRVVQESQRALALVRPRGPGDAWRPARDRRAGLPTMALGHRRLHPDQIMK